MWRAVKRERVTEQDAAVTQRIREHLVWRRARCIEAVRFRENDIQRDGRGPARSQSIDELTDDVPAPRPLAHRRQAAIVDVYDDDAIGGRPGLGSAKESVVGAVFQVRRKAGRVSDSSAVTSVGSRPQKITSRPGPNVI